MVSVIADSHLLNEIGAQAEKIYPNHLPVLRKSHKSFWYDGMLNDTNYEVISTNQTNYNGTIEKSLSTLKPTTTIK